MKRRLLASTIVAGAVFAAPAYAQTSAGSAAPIGPAASNPSCTPGSTDAACQTSVAGANSVASSDGSNNAGEIVVTGSRIPHPDLESASPVTIVGSQQIKQFGTTRVEDLLNQLPQVFADQSSTINNGGTGTAEIDLRGLGTSRTLTLVNGRRLVPGDPASADSAADINMIPASLIKRVDIFTGGASSVYGADAVAGVVNFVMDTDYSGFKLDGQYSFYQHDNRAGSNITDALKNAGFGYPTGNTVDGGTVDVTAVIGAGFDDNRGHVTAYGSYRKINAITQDARDYSACTLASHAAGNFTCGGSPTAFPATFLTINPYSYYHVSGHDLLPGPSIYNYAPTNYYQRNDERYTAGFFAHYNVSDAFKPYMEFMFMDDKTQTQIAASGDFFSTSTVNCDNPLLSAQEVSIICQPSNLTPDGTSGMVYIGRRNVEGGGRIDTIEHTQYRGVIGAKGDIAKGLSYDAYYQYGRTTQQERQSGYFSISKLTNALDVITDPTTGLPVCASGGACVPYNIFQDGGVTQAALDYLSVPSFASGTNTEQVADASVTFLGGEYGLTSPMAHTGFSLNVGVEYRKETSEYHYDAAASSGDLAGFGSAPQDIQGAFDVKEAFVEASLPLIQDRPFFQDLTLNGGYRRSRYSVLGTGNHFNTNTFKGEIEWSPVRDVKLRGTYNRAVRAPNISELFGPNLVGLDGSSDPCAGTIAANGTVNGFTAAQCANTGVTAAQFGHINPNPAQQYNGFLGGNTALTPEVANSITGGVVLTPSFLKGFTATVDYFRIKIKNSIGTLGADNILNQCVTTGSAQYCGLIHRDPNGSLFRTTAGYVVDTLQNVTGTTKTSGIDVNLAYSMPLGDYGTLGASIVGTWLHELNYGQGYDCAGYFGRDCGTPSPKWRHNAKLTFTSASGPGIQLGWRYFSHVKNDALNPDTGEATPNPTDAKIKAYSYFDLSTTVPLADKLTLRAGINNILDKQPPINGLGLGSENGNSFSQVYDVLGRYVFFGATLDL